MHGSNLLVVAGHPGSFKELTLVYHNRDFGPLNDMHRLSTGIAGPAARDFGQNTRESARSGQVFHRCAGAWIRAVNNFFPLGS